MVDPLEIRNSVSGKILPAIGPVIIGAMFGFGALQGAAAGANSGHVLWIALLAAACLALGFFIARGAFDTSVKVVLNSQGFRDSRAGDVLVPWRKVRSVRLASGGKGAAMLNFELTEEPPDAIRYAAANAFGLMPFGKTTVHMEISSLDIRGDDMVEAVKAFAPHVVVRR
ncbi:MULTISPECIES: hypothetical protein [unclassified Mesorhizobium]|uniref:hypothetical protein n=1 Tax=unclassified Mesorhizobium TaxID=325217 RepID=UPI000BAED923|nr:MULTISPECIES: hypothetical protein [unclassified Mesorhizobium]TGT60472.1 hypothetical protein EN813_022530 [Mesorhizobium sp. M00.F.Ca.ET.170.01.1.1]AZO10423.1 hypothetical protein EJ074_15775 [Mesorhizobium sp. M3A.F.Ca.ET.080.04.2.1]PBB87945.1 hypothetical protein CK216_05320 [Mesorhizobium sp. WSM3876]RWB69081.1 MAG: hypothetical protein EOQ49_20805 [Mesorhizobium sp.]RWB91863.1 MAG: hypothetical protein EOQ52_05845 [Mesorhizobium sp.]